MKKLVNLTLFVFCIYNLYAQDLKYDAIINVDSTSQNELYARAKLFLAKTYNSPKDIIVYDDKENGAIICNAKIVYESNVFRSSSLTRGVVSYTLSISIKENKYKYKISEFYHNAYAPNGISMGIITVAKECPNPYPLAKSWSNNVWQDLKKQINQNIIPVIENMNVILKTPVQEGW